MDASVLWIGSIAFLAALTQGLSGFGVALVSMALLPVMIGIKQATPLVALIAVVVDIAVLVRYRESLDVHAIWRVILASLIGTPVGILFLSAVDERVSLIVLGVVLAGYGLYALLGFRLPDLDHPFWAYGSGFLGGLLGGAYNTSGPPVIVYADCQSWPRGVFKSNLNSYFLISSAAVLVGHWVKGNFTPSVMHSFWWSLPFIGLGLLTGFQLDRWLKPATFRKIVLLMLIGMGVRMML